MTLRIANAAGFWGDDISAPRRLVESATVDYLTLEYLAELTMSILAHQKSKDPSAGFAHDVVAAILDISAVLKRNSNLKVITNAGGVNPSACASAVSRVMVDAGLGNDAIAVVTGDDLLPRLSSLRVAGCAFVNIDTGQALRELTSPVVSANAYLGAQPIARALADGGRIVITGRVADASLTVAPAVHEYHWSWDDWQLLGSATVAGHLIECGAQVTGGYSDRWREIDLVNIGYPIAEIESDGTTVITKPLGSGGIVDRRSVVEQLLYEIGNPAAYHTPDVVADFTNIEVQELGPNRVQVFGAGGKPPSDMYKVSLAYQAGYMASAQLFVRGIDSVEKATFAGELVFKRMAREGISLERTNIECLGAGGGADAGEVMLRISIHDSNRASVERFTREIAPLITNGPSGLAGYASGRASVRPVLAYWPTMVPKSMVQPAVEVRPAREWTGG